MKIKRKLLSHIEYTWMIYLAILLTAVLIWSAVFGYLEKPDKNEKIVIAFFTNNWNSDPLVAELNDNRSKITDQALQAVTSKNHDLQLFMLTTFIGMRLTDSDILIMPESLFGEGEDQLEIGEVIRPIDESLFDQIVGDEYQDWELYKVNGTVYGVYLNNFDGNENLFESYFEEEDRYIAFFSHYSENLSGLYGEGSKTDSAAVDMLTYLLQIK